MSSCIDPPDCLIAVLELARDVLRYDGDVTDDAPVIGGDQDGLAGGGSFQATPPQLR